MITTFVKGVDILKLTRWSGENQVKYVLFSSGEVYHLF